MRKTSLLVCISGLFLSILIVSSCIYPIETSTTNAMATKIAELEIDNAQLATQVAKTASLSYPSTPEPMQVNIEATVQAIVTATLQAILLPEPVIIDLALSSGQIPSSTNILTSILSVPTSTLWIYEREAEFPDDYTVGSDIERENASTKHVHGRIGTGNIEPWDAKEGYVKYKGIKTPKTTHLILELWYSKNSDQLESMDIFIDDESKPVASFIPQNQGDWNHFASHILDLGPVEEGIHAITIYTKGQQYGVADLDKFALMAIPLAPDDIFLDSVARDTWNYLSSDWATDHHLPWSWRSATISGGSYVNTAEIGLYALSWIGAYEMQRDWSPAWTEVEAEVISILDQLRAWQSESQEFQPNGGNAFKKNAFYQWYWLDWRLPIVGGIDGNNQDVPSIDNAWLAASLLAIREYTEYHEHMEIAHKADEILRHMDFSLWYDSETKLFWFGTFRNTQGGTRADYYSNENRIINFVARSLNHISAEEFQSSLEALVAPPGIYGGITVEAVAWDGSIFTYLAPALFIREIETDYGQKTIIPAVEAQIKYADDNNYVAWGLTDGFDIEAEGYIQQGSLPAISQGTVEKHPGVIAPHASALALITPLKSAAINNLQTISATFPSAYDTSYGFRESILLNPSDPQYGVSSDRFSALGQSWLFLSIVNAETNFIWEYLYQDEGVMTAHLEMFGEHPAQNELQYNIKE